MKKIYIYIIMIVGIVLILMGSILTLTNKKEEIPKKEEEKEETYDPLTDFIDFTLQISKNDNLTIESSVKK